MFATVRVLLAIGLLGVAAWAVTSQPAVENLIKNGSFETPGAFGQIGAPDHWEGIGMGTFPAIAQDCTVAHDGKCSMKIMTDKFAMASVLQELKLKPNHYYRLTAWVKTDHFEIQAESEVYGSITAFVTDPNGNNQIDHTEDHKGTVGWTQMTLDFKAGESGTTNIMCNYCGQGAGKGVMWFDDVRLVPIDKPTATATAPAGKPASSTTQASRPAASRPE